LSTGAACVTPCGISVSRRDTFTVTVEKAGYQTKSVEVGTRLTASGVGDLGENIVTGGAGAVVDVATGAALEHVPNPLRVTLAPMAGRRVAADSRRTP
ncbi:MAG TPA: translation initiation factor 2, partial [Lichenihabitans sp.]|nr:translation initiation factor 2 [Lichenihabitans sp.]